MTQNSHGWLNKMLLVRRGEWATVSLSFVYFFFLLAGYFVLRPLRETAAIKEGTGALPWLYSSVFVIMLLIVPLYGWLVARVPKRTFLPAVYGFFVLSALAISLLFGQDDYSLSAAAGFYVWLSVFNLFVVSVFWSFMVDLFSPGQAKRLFPFIAAGGSLGAIIGPLLTRWLVESLGIQGLIWLAAGLLAVALSCQLILLRQLPQRSGGSDQDALGGSVIAGATAVFRNRYIGGLALVLAFLPIMNTFLYFMQGDLIYSQFSTDAERAQFFSRIDFWANAIAFLCPLFVTGRLLRSAGPALTLIVMPLITVIGYLALAVSPSVGLLLVVQAIRRGGEYGLMKPARKLLWTPVDEEAKYKAMNFVDTAVYRGGDVSTGWLYSALTAVFGLSVAAMAAIAAPLAGVWAAIVWRMGKHYENEYMSNNRAD